MLLPYADRNLILTGYTGPMPLSIGQHVAEKLRLRYVNADVQVEARGGGMDIEAMRMRLGDTRLKMIESEVMQEVMLYRGAVIKVSGQTLLRGEYIKRLQQTGYVICLIVSLDAALRKLHLSMGGQYHNPSDRSLAVGRLKREWAIRKQEGVMELDVTDQSDSEVVESVRALWEKVAMRG
jgi:shikimate kinase